MKYVSQVDTRKCFCSKRCQGVIIGIFSILITVYFVDFVEMFDQPATVFYVFANV